MVPVVTVAKWFGYCDGESRSDSSACEQDRWTIPDEANNGLKHGPGKLAMAKTSKPRIREVASSTSCQREVRPAISMASTLCLER